jgi:predicted HNH restriction endonuclease
MICRKCNQDLPETDFSPGMLLRWPSHHFCRKCNRERCQEYIDKHPEKKRQYDADNYKKRKYQYQARDAIRSAIEYRGFEVQPCQVCRRTDDVEGHHPSYLPEEWLTVVWLCPICHKGVHRKRIDISNLPTYTATPIQGRWGDKIAV